MPCTTLSSLKSPVKLQGLLSCYIQRGLITLSSFLFFYFQFISPTNYNSHFIKNFFYYYFLFLAVLGLRCCEWAFSSCSEQGLLCVAVRRLLIAVASLVVEHGL